MRWYEWVILGGGVCVAVYVLSALQMHAWLGTISKFLDKKILKDFKKQEDERQKEEQ